MTMDVEFEDTNNTMNWAGQILMVSTHFAWLGEGFGCSPVPPTGPGMWHQMESVLAVAADL